MSLPIGEDPPVPSRLSAIWGTATVSGDPALDAAAVARLGEIVHQRCPIASMVVASGCELDIRWRVAGGAEPESK